MSKQVLRKLIEKGNVEHLEALLEIKTKIGSLQQRRAEVAKEMEEIDNELETAFDQIPELDFDLAPARKAGKVKTEGETKPERQRSGLKAELVVEVIKEASKPMGVDELAEALVANKGMPDTGKNLRSNLRVMLYQNRKGLFIKVDKGVFGLAQGPEGGGEETAPAEPATTEAT